MVPPLSTTGPREGPVLGSGEGAEMGISTILIQRIKRIGPLLVITLLCTSRGNLKNLVQNFHLISARSLFLAHRLLTIKPPTTTTSYNSAVSISIDKFTVVNSGHPTQFEIYPPFWTIAGLLEPITAGFFFGNFACFRRASGTPSSRAQRPFFRVQTIGGDHQGGKAILHHGGRLEGRGSRNRGLEE